MANVIDLTKTMNLVKYIQMPILVVFDEKDTEKVETITVDKTKENCKETIIFHDNVRVWLDANVSGKYTVRGFSMIFENESDLIHFKMVWM
ncbi:MAG: hypothetical protein HC836_39965 [Richelia sp. RM2_1_2]|nr:hypothetical protein [Richelia sp. RM2_1_2]